MYKQRQRELQLERAQMAVDDQTDETDKTTKPDATTITSPRLEDNTLPAPKTEPGEPRVNPEPPKKEAAPAATPPQSRPREAEPAKKKGKKGDDGPPG
jgi:hypothetical protein